jgi:hypothetical protein
VTVTPNVQVEFRWITDVAWFGKVEVFDNPYGTGAPIVTRQSVDAWGEAVAATQQDIVVPVGPGSDGKQSRSRDAHAAAVVLHGGACSEGVRRVLGLVAGLMRRGKITSSSPRQQSMTMGRSWQTRGILRMAVHAPFC